MERYLKSAAGAAVIVLLAASGAWAATAAPKAAAKAAPAAAHAAKGKAGAAHGAAMARLGGHPNLNGVWQVADSSIDWDLQPHDAQEGLVSPELLGALGAAPPGRGVVDGGTLPYLPAAQAQLDTNIKSAPKADPEAACYLPGIPRATYAASMPFQIIQGDKGDMLMAYQYDSANRTIYMQKTEQPPIDTWMGTSYGHWVGDTLEIDTLGQNGMTWLDRKGDYLQEGDGTKVTERFSLIDHDHMRYDVSVTDPTTFSRPWKMSMILYRRVEPNAELLDFRCVPFADLLVYGDLLQNKNGAK